MTTQQEYAVQPVSIPEQPAHPAGPTGGPALTLPSITSLLPQDRSLLDFRRQSAPAGRTSQQSSDDTQSRSLSYPNQSIFAGPPSARSAPVMVPMIYPGYPAQGQMHPTSVQSSIHPAAPLPAQQAAAAAVSHAVQLPPGGPTQIPQPPLGHQLPPQRLDRANGHGIADQQAHQSGVPTHQPSFYAPPTSAMSAMAGHPAVSSSTPQQLHKAPGMVPQMPITQNMPNTAQITHRGLPNMIPVHGMMGPTGPIPMQAAGPAPHGMHPMMGLPMTGPVRSAPTSRAITPSHPYLAAAAAAAAAGAQRAYMWAPTAVPQSQPFTQEIKRRTKTGCLTCRKRRIKCDEKYPVCKNCSKSDRICLGYDPVFGVGKGSRTVNLRAQRQAFAERHKISRSPTEPVTVSEWSEVSALFARYLAPQLDRLFGVQRFSNISSEVTAQFERGENMYPRETRLAGELEVMRLLLAIVMPNHDFESLDVLDIVKGSLDKLRVAEDYRLLRAVYDAFSLPGSKNLAVSPLDEQLVPRLQVLNRLIYALPSTQLRSPMQIDHVERAKSPVAAADLWPLLVEMAQGLSLSASQIDYLCQLPQQPEAGISEAMLLVGVLSAASPLNRPRVCHALLEMCPKAQALSQTIIELAMAYESK